MSLGKQVQYTHRTGTYTGFTFRTSPFFEVRAFVAAHSTYYKFHLSSFSFPFHWREQVEGSKVLLTSLETARTTI